MIERLARPRYLAAVAALLAIPVVAVCGVALYAAIDADFSAGHSNYVRNYRLIGYGRSVLLGATGIAMLVLWGLCCLWVVQSKRRAVVWGLLGLLGPPGLIAIALLRDADPDEGFLHDRLLAALRGPSRIAFEAVIFVALAAGAVAIVSVSDVLSAFAESKATGVPIEIVAERRDAESGMRSFGDAVGLLYLVPLAYVLRPVVVNALGFLARRRV